MSDVQPNAEENLQENTQENLQENLQENTQPVAEAPTAEAPTAEAPTAEAPAAEAPAAEAPTAEAPAAEPHATVVHVSAAVGSVVTITPEEFAAAQEAEKARREEERKRKEEERKQREAAFETLSKYKEEGTAFEVEIKERVKGGLRGDFGTLRVFLPASHYGLRKNVAEEELNQAIGQTVRVKVHELQSDETGYKSAVVTRRDILMDDFWGTIEKGAAYEGVVTSVTTFGAFVNIGGIEGLVHVSRLSRSRIEDPTAVVKKGDKLMVTVVEADREKRKLSLSHKEHEADAWANVETQFPAGSRVKGTVKRITDFGAYVQVAPKIEGLLRISELSWTKRVKHPSDVVSVDQEIEVEILSANAAKHQLALGYKQTQPNPWLNIAETLPVGTETTGVVQQTTAQGAVVRINDTFDGFMPRSKMVNAGRGKKVELNAGDQIPCVIVDLNPAAASLILAMKNEDGTIAGSGDADRQEGGYREGGYREGGRRERSHESSGHHEHAPTGAAVTLGDMLRDLDKSKLNG